MDAPTPVDCCHIPKRGIPRLGTTALRYDSKTIWSGYTCSSPKLKIVVEILSRLLLC